MSYDKSSPGKWRNCTKIFLEIHLLLHILKQLNTLSYECRQFVLISCISYIIIPLDFPPKQWLNCSSLCLIFLFLAACWGEKPRITQRLNSTCNVHLACAATCAVGFNNLPILYLFCSWFESQFLCGVSMFCPCMCGLCGHSGFLPLSKNVYVRLIDHSKLTL